MSPTAAGVAVQALVFDFDGVLIESVDIKTRAFAQLFAGEPPETVQRIIDFHLRHGGLSRVEKLKAMYREILGRPLPEDRLEALCRAFSELVVNEVVMAPWVEGAEAFLLQHRGRYRFFIVSGTPEEELREIVRRRAIEPLFDGVFGSPRTKEVLLQDVLRDAGLPAAEMVFVGDSATDWAAAHATGVAFIWRPSPHAPALSGFAGPRIRSLVELEGCLMAIERNGALRP